MESAWAEVWFIISRGLLYFSTENVKKNNNNNFLFFRNYFEGFWHILLLEAFRELSAFYQELIYCTLQWTLSSAYSKHNFWTFGGIKSGW